MNQITIFQTLSSIYFGYVLYKIYYLNSRRKGYSFKKTTLANVQSARIAKVLHMFSNAIM